MHLDEGVEPVAQKALVLSRGHAVEQLEELFLLLGGSWTPLCLCMCYRARLAERRERGGWGGGRGVTSTRVTPSQVRMSEEAVGGAC